jgi:hypothetical protein
MAAVEAQYDHFGQIMTMLRRNDGWLTALVL